MIYVIGHKNPDTDSIASSLALAELKNKLGIEAVAKRLGTLNEECKFATRYFDVEAPSLIDDARSRLSDLELDSPIVIKPETSCLDALAKITPTLQKTACVYKESLKGIVSLSDLANIYLKTPREKSELLTKSTIDIIASGVNGEIKYNSNREQNGKVIIYFKEYPEDLNDSITLVTFEESLKLATNDNPSMIIFNGDDLSSESIDLCASKNISLIHSSLKIDEILSNIYQAIPVSLIMKENVTTFNDDEFVNDVSLKLLKSRFRSYPVLNKDKEVVGVLSRYHLANYNKKKFVLVDHSSFLQSINHLEDAEIVEVVDHHHIGGLITKYPVFYRNEILGCTCSIIYKMFKENGLRPSYGVAGMMLSAIISDTLNFKSKTTTEQDVRIAKELADLIEIDLNIYAEELLAAGADIKKAKIETLVESDLKQYTFKNIRYAIGQTNYTKVSDIESRIADFREYLKQCVEKQNLDLIVMMFTSIKNEETLFLFYGSNSELFSSIIEKPIDEHYGYDSKIVSRKQQLVPLITDTFEKTY